MVDDEAKGLSSATTGDGAWWRWFSRRARACGRRDLGNVSADIGPVDLSANGGAASTVYVIERGGIGSSRCPCRAWRPRPGRRARNLRPRRDRDGCLRRRTGARHRRTGAARRPGHRITSTGTGRGAMLQRALYPAEVVLIRRCDGDGHQAPNRLFRARACCARSGNRRRPNSRNAPVIRSSASGEKGLSSSSCGSTRSVPRLLPTRSVLLLAVTMHAGRELRQDPPRAPPAGPPPRSGALRSARAR